MKQGRRCHQPALQAGWWLLLALLLASAVAAGGELPPGGQQQQAAAPLGSSSSSSSSSRAPSDVSGAAQQGPAAVVAPPPAPARVPVFTVAWMSAAMAAASSLGVVPFFFVGKLSKPWAGAANSVACGVMLTASYGLLGEGAAAGPVALVAGMLLGAAFVSISESVLEQYEVESFEELAGAEARRVILFLAVMAVHAVGEGSGVGVSFAGRRGWAQGTLVTLAIGLHNVPEGLAVATVMAAKGASPRKALMWTSLTAAPQALVAVPAYLFVDQFKTLLPLALGFAAGCMVWIVFAELLPDALEALPSQQVASTVTCSAAGLQALSLYIAHLEQPDGHLAAPWGHAMAPRPHAAPGGATSPGAASAQLLWVAPLALLAAAASSVASARALPARPVQLGLTAGLLVGGGALQWLAALAAGRHALLVTRLVLPLVGVVAAVASYAAVPGLGGHGARRTLSRGGSRGEHGKDPGAAAAAAALARAGQAPDGHWQPAATGAAPQGWATPAAEQQQQQQQYPDHHLHVNGHANGHLQPGFFDPQQQQQPAPPLQGFGSQAPPWPAAVAPAPEGAAPHPWPLPPAPAPAAGPTGATVHLRVNSASSRPPPGGRQLDALPAAGSPRNWLARTLSGGGGGAPNAKQPWPGGGGGEADDALLPLTLLPAELVPRPDRARRGVQRLAGVSLAGLALAGVAPGRLLAEVLVQRGGVAAAALVLLGSGVFFGLSATGLLVQLVPLRRRLALYSSALAALPLLVAAASLWAGDAAGAALYWLQLLASGYSACCGALFCWPAARGWNDQQAASGLLLGGALSVVLHGLVPATCAALGVAVLRGVA